MKWLKDAAFAAFRKGWDLLVSTLKWAWQKLTVLGNTIYDPPPVAYKRLFFTALAIFLAGGVTFSFTRSWFYKPTVAYFTTMFEDGDVVLPEHVEPQPLPEVVTRLPSVPSVEVVCHDMSDTPQCEEVQLTPKAENGVRSVEEVMKVIPTPIVEPVFPKKASGAIKKRKRIKATPYQTYWGF